MPRRMAVTKMPDWLEPMAAALTQDRFAGGDWLFERNPRLLGVRFDKDARSVTKERA